MQQANKRDHRRNIILVLLAGLTISCQFDLDVDTAPPKVPDVSKLELIRRPHGDVASEVSRTSLVIGDGAVEEGARLEVLLPGVEAWTLLASAEQAPVEVAIDVSGQPTVTVRAVDAAGNASDGVQTTRGVWVTTPTGSTNQLRVADRALDVRDSGAVVSATVARDAAQIDGDALSAVARRRWSIPVESIPDQLLSLPSVAYDANAGALMVLGTGTAQELWVWTPDSMRRAVDAPGLEDRSRVAFDPVRDRLLAFGRAVGSPETGATRIFDGAAWSTPTQTSPSGREGHAMVYDAARDEILLFGGEAAVGFVGDTWAFADNTWRQVASDGPSPRAWAGMTFDPRCDCVLLFGGDDEDDTLWAWDGTSWSARSERGPEPRHGAQLVFDARRQRVLLTDGEATTPLHNWYHDGSQWVRRELVPPGGVRERSAFYDPTLREILAFDHRGNIWVRREDRWVGTNDPVTPELGNPTLLWHPDLQEIVLIGAVDGATRVLGFNGFSWRRIDLEDAPSAVDSPVTFFDAGDRSLVRFAGRRNFGRTSDLWRSDGVGWWLDTSAGPRPVPSFGAMATPEGDAHATWFFGGLKSTELDETWLFTGLGPREVVTTEAPGPRYDSAATWEPRTRSVVLHGGRRNGEDLSDTWRWNGSRWVEITAPGAPSRFGGAFAADVGRGRIILQGGLGSEDRAELLELDGRGWTPVFAEPSQVGTLPNTRDGLFAYDPALDALVLYRKHALQGETWRLDPSRSLHPAVQLDVDLSASLMTPQTLAVVVDATATSNHDGVTTDGIVVEVWNPRYTVWEALSFDASAGAYVERDPAVIASWTHAKERMSIRVRTAGVDVGEVAAQLRVDAMHAAFEYDVTKSAVAPTGAPTFQPASAPPVVPVVFEPSVSDGVPIHPSARPLTVDSDACAVLPVEPYAVTGPRHGELFGDVRHLGDDVGATPGASVRAAFEGVVLTTTVTPDGGFVEVRHFTSSGRVFMGVYGHLDDIEVSRGDVVQPGTQLGAVAGGEANGGRDPHLWFALYEGLPGASIPTHVMGALPSEHLNPSEVLVAESVCSCRPDACGAEPPVVPSMCEEDHVLTCEVDPHGCPRTLARARCARGLRCEAGRCVVDECPDLAFEWVQRSTPPEWFESSSVPHLGYFANQIHLTGHPLIGSHWRYALQQITWFMTNDLPRGPIERIVAPLGTPDRLLGLGGRQLDYPVEWTGATWSVIGPRAPHGNNRVGVHAYTSTTGATMLWTYDETGRSFVWEVDSGDTEWTMLPTGGAPDWPGTLTAYNGRLLTGKNRDLHILEPGASQWTEYRLRGSPVYVGSAKLLMFGPYLLIVRGADAGTVRADINVLNLEANVECPDLELPIALRRSHILRIDTPQGLGGIYLLGGYDEAGDKQGAWIGTLYDRTP
ncbi:MAG: peptidoglycan DD-metalloendopeptidase family protein [Deltaproteobacteria bacterium]